MIVQTGLCRTWSETQIVRFLTHRLKLLWKKIKSTKVIVGDNCKLVSLRLFNSHCLSRGYRLFPSMNKVHGTSLLRLMRRRKPETSVVECNITCYFNKILISLSISILLLERLQRLRNHFLTNMGEIIRLNRIINAQYTCANIGFIWGFY